MANMAEALASLARTSEEQLRLLEREDRRRRTEEDERYRERYDRPGARRSPRPVDTRLFLQAVPGLAGQFKTVIPGEFWTQMDKDIATVSCPCGHVPEVPHEAIKECDCNRFYLWTGPEMRVAKYDTCSIEET